MDRTKDELLLECIKQFEHIENVLGCNRLSTTRSLINKINQALTIPADISSVCDIHKGTRCEKSFPSYTDGKCRECGGQAN